MATLISWVRREWLTCLIIAASAFLQILIVSQDMRTLVATVLPDDAFYYFQIARNIGSGVGSTMDGVHLTNGYHPLWMMILVPLFKYFSTPYPNELPIHIALFIQIGFNIVTAFICARLLRRVSGDPLVRAFGIFILLLNPFYLYYTVNGMETSLSLMLLSMFMWLGLRYETQTTRNRALVLGLVGGLVTLARLDLLVFVSTFPVWLLTHYRRRTILTDFISFSAGVLILVIPYFVWNYVTFHMFLTSASQAAGFAAHAEFTQAFGHGLMAYIRGHIGVVRFALRQLVEQSAMPAIVYILCGATISLLARHDLRSSYRRNMPLIFVFAIAFGLFFLADSLVRAVVREYYFMSFYILLSLAMVASIQMLIRSGMNKYARYWILMLLFAGSAYSFLDTWASHMLPGRNPSMNSQAWAIDAAEWARLNLPAHSRIGTMGSGVLTYYAQQPVVNLDGLVNISAYQAMREHRVGAYILAETDYVWADPTVVSPDGDYDLMGTTTLSNRLVPVGQVPTESTMSFYKVL